VVITFGLLVTKTKTHSFGAICLSLGYKQSNMKKNMILLHICHFINHHSLIYTTLNKVDKEYSSLRTNEPYKSVCNTFPSQQIRQTNRQRSTKQKLIRSILLSEQMNHTHQCAILCPQNKLDKQIIKDLSKRLMMTRVYG
jgi:hypothetical protein